MEQARVIKLQIYPNEEQAQSLSDTMLEYCRVCNFVSQWVFDNDFVFSHKRINDALYYQVRADSSLNAHMVQNTFRTVTAKYKTVQTQLLKAPVKYKDGDEIKKYYDAQRHLVTKDIYWLQKPIQFKTPQCDLVRNEEYSFVDNGQMLSISTINGRIKIPFRCCSHFAPLLDWKLGTAKLVYKFNRWFIHISATREISDYVKEGTQTVVGIDRGLRFITVTYDGINTFFCRGAGVIEKRHHFAKVRQQLQSKNTKSSRRRLRRIESRENRYMTDFNHCLSKALVQNYDSNTLYILEDLEGVSIDEKNLRCSKQNRADKRSWAFYQLEQFLKYKAEAVGSFAINVSPRYTSQRCPVCGVVDKTQRNHDRHEYHCHCGYRSNDDRVGAINIRELGLRYLNGQKNPKFVKTKVTRAV